MENNALGEERLQDCHPEASADLADHVEHAARLRHFTVRNIFHRQHRERGEHHAHGDPAEIHGKHDLGMFGENGKLRIQIETDAEKNNADDDRHLGVDFVRQEAGNRSEKSLDKPDGQQHHARLERRIAEDVLQVERDEKNTAEHADAENKHDEVREPEIVSAQEAEIDQRVFDVKLYDEERYEADDRKRVAEQHEVGGPAARVPL